MNPTNPTTEALRRIRARRAAAVRAIVGASPAPRPAIVAPASDRRTR